MERIQERIRQQKTLRETLVESLRDAIIRGTFEPGAKISESELAGKFGISRTPVREAIRQLESEGFLTVLPRRGAVVSSFTAKDVQEFYDLKALLEGYAVRLAIERLTDADIERMRVLNQQMVDYAAEDNPRALFKAHNEFHEVFINKCGNDKLKAVLTSLLTQFQRFRYLLTVAGKTEGSIAQHWDIIDALKARDPDRAEQLVRDNATYGEEVLIHDILAHR